MTTDGGVRSCGMIFTVFSRVLFTLLLVGMSAPPSSGGEETAASACLYGDTGHRWGSGFTPCIRQESFNLDLCRTIEYFALQNDLQAAFFARLIWRESLFRPASVSPKGAEGIAQFMPSTARLRGLSNSFDVVQALNASSLYLSDLRSRFGNLGLAAAAYNAGEAGLTNFLNSGRLPIETRDYVFAVTGHTVETWKSDPPKQAAPELDDGKSFIDGCVALADSRRMAEPVLVMSADWAPWGVQLAAHADPSVAGRLFDSTIARLPSPVSAERAVIIRQRGGNFGYRPRYAARIGRETRAQAMELCRTIRAAGTACTVFRN